MPDFSEAAAYSLYMALPGTKSLHMFVYPHGSDTGLAGALLPFQFSP